MIFRFLGILENIQAFMWISISFIILTGTTDYLDFGLENAFLVGGDATLRAGYPEDPSFWPYNERDDRGSWDGRVNSRPRL
jgi:2-keto-4-pentenoate hydratase/2-oxohepta-3-ene-1,7-dioic acid hydratase in catechol pathway